MGLRSSLSHHRKRQIEGCFWLGCFTPLALSIIALQIVAKYLTERLRPHT
jgi:hypothetical protein